MHKEIVNFSRENAIFTGGGLIAGFGIAICVAIYFPDWVADEVTPMHLIIGENPEPIGFLTMFFGGALSGMLVLSYPALKHYFHNYALFICAFGAGTLLGILFLMKGLGNSESSYMVLALASFLGILLGFIFSRHFKPEVPDTDLDPGSKLRQRFSGRYIID